MLIKALSNPFTVLEKSEDKALSEFLNDIVKYEYSRIFTTNNSYNHLKAFKMVNVLSRIYFLFCEREIECTDSGALYKVINQILLTDISNLEITKEELLFSVLHLLNGLFLKENWVGPSYLSPKAEKVLKEELGVDHNNKYELDLSGVEELNLLLESAQLTLEELNNFTFKNVKNEKFLIKEYGEKVDRYFMLNGEEYTRQLKLLDLFVLYARSIEFLSSKDEFKDSIDLKLNLARVYNLHTQILEGPTPSLKDKLIDTYKTILASLKDSSEEKDDIRFFCFVKLEYALIILNYYKYKESKSQILEAMSLLGIEINFTGKLGIRTKYQTNKLPQLTVEISNTNTEEQEESVIGEEKNKPTVKKLDEIFDNILHEKPILDEINKNDNKLSLEENMVVAALIKNMRRSFPMDDMLREQITAYLRKTIDDYHNWTILLNNLITRSDMEFSNNKKMERAMIQYEQIVKDWHSKECSLDERIKYVYFLNFPHFLDIMTSFAENYKKANCYMSAAALYEDCGLFEEAVECKSICGNKDQALELLKKLPDRKLNTPKMLCVLGEIHKDISYYKKAMDVSKGKYKKAQKALGRFYFINKNYEEALVYYKNAVNLNEMDLMCWLNMGYIYMSTNDSKGAIHCFQKAVFIDDSQSKAWANLAVLFKGINKPEEAFNSIKEAVKQNERNWQMWYNYLIMAMDTKNFSGFVKGCRKVIELNHPEQLKEFIIKRFNIVLEHEFEKKNKPHSFRQIELLSNRWVKQSKEDIHHTKDP